VKFERIPLKPHFAVKYHPGHWVFDHGHWQWMNGYWSRV